MPALWYFHSMQFVYLSAIPLKALSQSSGALCAFYTSLSSVSKQRWSLSEYLLNP